MLKIEVVDHRSADWKLVFNASLIFNDAFRYDFIRSEYWPARFDLSKLPLNAGYDRLLKYPAFKIATTEMAWHIYVSMRSNPRYRLLLFRDSMSDEAVGMAVLALPEYVAVPEPSWLSRLWTYVLRAAFRVHQIWMYKQLANPLHPPEMGESFAKGSRMCEALPTAERVAYLQELSRDELAKTTYPKPWSYYLNFFALRASMHGTGVGKQMMDGIVHETLHGRLGPVTEPPFDGPAKMELFSSPMAVNFYKRYGFSIGAEYTETMPSGRNLTHTYFFKNLT